MALQEEMEQQGLFLFKYRGILPLVGVMVALGVYIYEKSQHVDQDLFVGATAYERICLIVSLSGLLFRIFVIGHAHRKTSGRNTKEQVADNVNTSGIYSIMRHPLYTGNLIMWIGIALLTRNFWFIMAFMAAYVVYYERIMFAEEQFLRKKFGQKYLDWAAHTPAFFPQFRNWRKPELNFSFRKVLRQEKNGLLAVFVLVFLFQQTADYIVTSSFQIKDWVVATGFIGSTLYYLVIKTLQKTTPIMTKGGR
ncbi:MAG: isoprenylcysteine carboxylmethyltransferase family protein [Breznakibacter sp.]